jgi:sRNA-binding regulator protein Hfq
MIKKYLAIVIISLLIFAAGAPPVSAQTAAGKNPAKVEKIKSSVRKRDINKKERVSVKMLNGTKIKGYISQAGEDSFTVTDDRSGQSTVIAYNEAEKVGSSGLSKGAKIAIGISAAAAGTLIVLYAAFQNAIKDN